MCYVMGQDGTSLTGPLIDKLIGMTKIFKFNAINKVSKQDNAFVCSVILFPRMGKERRQLDL